MEKSNPKKTPAVTPPVTPAEAPIDESPLVKPDVSKKDIEVKKKKSKTLKPDDWKI